MCIFSVFTVDIHVANILVQFSVHAGQTVIFPAGYIHGVHTSVDSIAFSGSFLTMQGMEMHHKLAQFTFTPMLKAQRGSMIHVKLFLVITDRRKM